MPRDQAGVAGAIASTFRQTGAAVGVAVTGAIRRSALHAALDLGPGKVEVLIKLADGPMTRTLGAEFVHFLLEQDGEVTLIDAGRSGHRGTLEPAVSVFDRRLRNPGRQA